MTGQAWRLLFRAHRAGVVSHTRQVTPAGRLLRSWYCAESGELFQAVRPIGGTR